MPMSELKTYALGILLILVGASMLGCKTAPRAVLPPDTLLEDCVVTLTPARKNADLITRDLEWRAALKMCNADKAALRVWRDRMRKDLGLP